MPEEASVVTLGRGKNLVVSEMLSGLIRRRKLASAGKPESVAAVIARLCGFIDAAKEESESTTRVCIVHAGEYEESGEGTA